MQEIRDLRDKIEQVENKNSNDIANLQTMWKIHMDRLLELEKLLKRHNSDFNAHKV